MSALDELLRCPKTGEPLVAATPAECAQAQQSVGVVNASRRWFYRIENGIPVLLPDEATSRSS